MKNKYKLSISLFLFATLALTACINDSSESSKQIESSSSSEESSSEIISSSQETKTSSPLSYSSDEVLSSSIVSSSEELSSSSEEEHVHTWNTTWSYDDDYHWHACSGCSEVKDKEAHAWEVVAKINPSPTEDGMIWYECDGCGHTKTEVVPYSN